MIHRILLLSLSVCISITLYAQRAIPDSLIFLFDKQLAVFPQEKIYLHTDKPYYISGERIWFRAHLVDAATHVPVSISRYVYVELINPPDSVVARIKIREEEGTYHGWLLIPDSIPESDYTLRAYTTFMRSQDENYFCTKVIRIGDPQSRLIRAEEELAVSSGRRSRVGKTASILTPDDDFYVAFYPEGGSLMQGAYCKLAFKAMNANGRAADVSGTVYDQDGIEITDIQSEHLGMGSFLFLAEKGNSYYAICENGKGQSKRFKLPVAVDRGYALSVNQTKDRIIISVLQPAESAQNDGLYLLAHSRGMVHFVSLWDTEKNLSFDPEQFPSGVLHLILFDGGMNPVSERLVFINNHDQAQADCQPDRDVFAARTLINNSVTVTDSEGEALPGSFSVAVTSDREVTQDSLSNILTHLLLASDLRGHIENPAYYFQNSNAPAYALDLLMRVQGWRRYNIPELAHGRLAEPASPLEVGAEIAGTIHSLLLGKPVEDIEVSATSFSGGYFDVVKTDAKGRFYLYDCEAPDSVQFMVGVVPGRGMTHMELTVDAETFPEITLPAAPPAAIDGSQFAKYIDKAERQYVSEGGMRTYRLSEVTVTAERKQKQAVYSPYYSSEMLAPYSRITEEDIKRMPGMDIQTFLAGKLAGLPLSRGVNTINGRKDPLLVIDNWTTGISELNTLHISDIAQIDILRDAAGTAAFGSRGVNGVIVVYTKRGEDNRDAPTFHIKTIQPLGYQQPAAFYAPKYDTSEKRNMPDADLRITIHWQPVVQTDSSGVASFEFYTADELTTYSVIIEGVTDDGRIIRQETKLFGRQ